MKSVVWERHCLQQKNWSVNYEYKSAGAEGFDFAQPSIGCNTFGRYEIALLCLGMMHFHFGHPKQALEVSMRKEFSIPLAKLTLSLWTTLELFLFVDYLLDGFQVLTEAVFLSQQVISYSVF